MAQVFGDYPGGDAEHAAHRRALQRRRSRRARTTCRRSRCRRASRSTTTSSTSSRAGLSRSGCERLRQLDAEGKLRHTARRVRRAPRLRDRDDQEDGVSRLLPDRLGLHPLRARAGHPGRPGPRLGRRQPRRLGAAHHRRRSARLRPDLRALPQSRARVAARYRRRLLRAAPRRGDRLRHRASTAARTSRRSSPSAR